MNTRRTFIRSCFSRLYIVLFLLFLNGCTKKELYQAGQGIQKSECLKNAVTEAQHNDCVNLEQKSFEDYKKEQEELKK